MLRKRLSELRERNPQVFLLDIVETAPLEEYLRQQGVLSDSDSVVSVTKAGEGNMNCVVRVRTERGSLVVKQARPWVEKYSQFEAPWDRACREAEFYTRVCCRPRLARLLPKLSRFDSSSRLLILEDLGEGGDYSSVYGGDRFTVGEIQALADFLSELHASFQGADGDGTGSNREMRELNHAHCFRIPLEPNNGLDLDAITVGLAALADELRSDESYTAEVERLGREVYLADGQHLVHGDFFPGSVLRTPGGPRVIDPEFCHWGRPEYDVGVFLAHLVLSDQPPEIQRAWVDGYRVGPGFDLGLMRGLAGVEMMRRLIGYAQLPLVRDLAWKRRILRCSREWVLNRDLAWEGDDGPLCSMDRRTFFGLGTAWVGGVLAGGWSTGLARAAEVRVDARARAERVQGLIVGSAIGDALGGPIEFQSRERVQTLVKPPKVWAVGEVLDAQARAAAVARLGLRSYVDLRPGTESYGQWNVGSLPGTITDDTRHKLVLFHALRRASARRQWPLTVKDLAQSYLDWPGTSAVVGHVGYEALAKDWLEEWQLGARWVLGGRDMSIALPPERMWQGLATCCGQMTLLPLAALYPGEPVEAYLAAYRLGFFDNGIGKDLNAALVAALAQALVTPIESGGTRLAFESVLRVMRETDPLRFRQIRWSERAVDRWLNLALRLARAAEGQPARLFASLEKEFEHTTKWEAQVPFVVTFACLELAEYDAMAALQLSMEWGHDTDSYAQLVAAFAGALLGVSTFRTKWQEAVIGRLKVDHGVDLVEESGFLSRARAEAGDRPLVGEP